MTLALYEFHEVANIFPMMSDEEYRNLVNDVKENGQHMPIYIWQNKIIDGRNRYKACCELGIAPLVEQWDGEGSLVSFVVSLNLNRRHLDTSQRAMVAARLANLGEGRPQKTAEISAVSQTQAATLLNVSPDAIQQGRRVIERATPQLTQLVERGDVAVSLAAEVADEPEEIQREVVNRVKEGFKPREAFRDVKRNVLHSSESNEWYTPAQYVDAARELMGGIDLDPATSEQANATVKAKKIYTVDDDGFAKQWKGCVWLNPPYGREEGEGSNQARWTQKLIDEYKAGRVIEAVLLVNAAPANKWFAPLWEYLVCFTDHRIRFQSPIGESSQPTHSNALVYLGKNKDGFIKHFAKFGAIVKRVG